MDGDAVFVVDSGRLLSLPRRLSRPALPASPPPPPPAPARPPPLSALSQLSAACLAHHFNRVDSLCGLPDDLGRFLFDAALAADLFPAPRPARPLRVFAEAFADTFAGRADLRGAGREAGRLATALAGVRELWLDACGLDGVPARVLARLGGLGEVRRVSVRFNGLWDERVRVLTAAWRFGGGKVEEVDVRDNKYLSHNCVRFFLDIPSLKRVIFSSTEELEKEFPLGECCRRGWKLQRRSDWPARQLGSSGWFAEVQRVWMDRGLLPDLPPVDAPHPGRCLVLTRHETRPVLQESRLPTAALQDVGDEAVLASYRP